MRDVNENPPVFEKSLYEAEVNEVGVVKMGVLVAFSLALERDYNGADLQY